MMPTFTHTHTSEESGGHISAHWLAPPRWHRPWKQKMAVPSHAAVMTGVSYWHRVAANHKSASRLLANNPNNSNNAVKAAFDCPANKRTRGTHRSWKRSKRHRAPCLRCCTVFCSRCRVHGVCICQHYSMDGWDGTKCYIAHESCAHFSLKNAEHGSWKDKYLDALTAPDEEPPFGLDDLAVDSTRNWKETLYERTELPNCNRHLINTQGRKSGKNMRHFQASSSDKTHPVARKNCYHPVQASEARMLAAYYHNSFASNFGKCAFAALLDMIALLLLRRLDLGRMSEPDENGFIVRCFTLVREFTWKVLNNVSYFRSYSLLCTIS